MNQQANKILYSILPQNGLICPVLSSNIIFKSTFHVANKRFFHTTGPHNQQVFQKRQENKKKG